MSLISSTSSATFPRERVLTLIHTVKNNSGDIAASALRELWTLSDQFEFKDPLLHPSIQLLPCLRNILLFSDDSVLLHIATGILWFLSRSDVGKWILAFPEVELFPLLLIMAKVPETPYQDHIINALSNIVLAEDTHPYLLQSTPSLYEVMLDEFRRRPDYFQLYKCMAGFAKKASNESIKLLIGTGLHTIVLNHLLVKTLSSAWTGNSSRTWSMAFLLAFSTSPAGAQAIYDSGKLEYFASFMNEQSIRGMQAAMTVANVLGWCHNNTSVRHISLVGKFHILSLILDLLDVTIDFRDERLKVRRFKSWRFGYGIFQLRDITSALRHFSMVKENQKMMISNTLLLSLTVKVLQDFVNNQEDYHVLTGTGFSSIAHAGGGGKDVTSATYLLELIVQLSFTGPEVREQWERWEKGLQPVLEALLRLSSDQEIPENVNILAKLILEQIIDSREG